MNKLFEAQRLFLNKLEEATGTNDMKTVVKLERIKHNALIERDYREIFCTHSISAGDPLYWAYIHFCTNEELTNEQLNLVKVANEFLDCYYELWEGKELPDVFKELANLKQVKAWTKARKQSYKRSLQAKLYALYQSYYGNIPKEIIINELEKISYYPVWILKMIQDLS